MAENGEDMNEVVLWSELAPALNEHMENIQNVIKGFNQLKDAHNVLAERVGLQSFILAKYLPADRIDAASKEYRAIREREILTENVPTAQA